MNDHWSATSAIGAGHRVLVSKLGLDGHDRGARIVAMMLRDAGFEVILLGRHQVIEDVVAVAVDEDVELVGISLLSGAHSTLIPDFVEALRAAGSDAVVVVGGVIPDEDRDRLHQCGVAAVFGPETSSAVIIERVAELVGGAGSKR
ncbi:MAG: cobalamin B12-binding domain-containing protein [Ilumatobacter sp.]|uniref:cobalamin B12-binding domain-containing protein n=1 Tax=Ilumatobacter sp. TaxID=1967498 RepID=UPI003919F5C9